MVTCQADRKMRLQLHFVITAGVLCHLFPVAAQVTSQTPPAVATDNAQPSGCHVELTAPPGNAPTPQGNPNKAPKVVVSPEQPVEISADECETVGKVYTLRGHVEIHFDSYVYHGDTVVYDSTSGEATAKGHASLDGGPRDMHIVATHGSYNVRSQTGKFYNVNGTTGARFRGNNVTLTSSNPLAFTAKVMEQTGQEEYVLYHGSVTSCEMPDPKWRFHAARIVLRVGDSAKVYNSTFRLKGVPVFFLPYASPPVERLGRQSGFLIPVISNSTSKGFIFGDAYYWAINRSMDATLGAEYMSKRGWLLHEDYRAKPTATSYLNFSYFQALDRGGPLVISTLNQDGSVTTSVQKKNQGGEDVKLNGEALFPGEVRGVASLEYLSSFLFREQFSSTFTQAVDSEVRSTAFLTKSIGGYSFNGYAARYQNFQSTMNPDDVVTILHTPAVELTGADHRIFGSPVYWSYDVAAEGVRRSEPGFVTPGLVGRVDVDPNLALPMFFRGWSLRPAVDLRNTLYTQQNVASASGPTPTESSLNRRTIDSTVEIRPPALERVFDRTFGGRKVKHVIEPRVIYRYTNGIEDFASIIRFDFRDVLSNTNEAEFGLIQRIYLKRADDCGHDQSSAADPANSAPQSCPPAGADEFITWEVKQKYFLDPNFGGAVVDGRRNVFTTTVDFTGIAFLTDPRRFSPLVSRLRIRAGASSDLDWQLDYDSKKGRINASTVYLTHRFGRPQKEGSNGSRWSNFFVAGSHAYLQVPGEIVFATTSAGTTLQLPPCIPGGISINPCVPQQFNQVRGLLGYGSPSKRGFSAAANVGYDFEFNEVQYTAAQTAFNWDCCGLSVEYRRFELGQVRRENQYRFAFTLANIGSFGNMKRQERLF